VPYLDHEVVEYAARIPAHLKLKRWNKKYMLKKAGSGIVPRKILERKKQGFNVPVNIWLAGELKELALDTLSEARAKDMGLFSPSYIQSLLNEHFSRRKDNSFQLWGLITFFIWYDLFVKSRGRSQ
jgi:asparagine synthase (glutamine-hydrolysing)